MLKKQWRGKKEESQKGTLTPYAAALLCLLALSASDGISEEGGSASPHEGVKSGEARPGLRRDRVSSRAESERILDRSAEIYQSVLQGTHGAVPQSVLKSAKCVSVFPSVVTVALAVGGTHGDGVAFCKNSAGEWGSPVFMDLTGGSLGVQLGAKSADVVIFYTGDTARSAIEKGRFTLTGELDAVAGKFEESYVPPAAGAVSYMRTEGAFAGASLGGVNVYRDKGTMKAFYGRSSKPEESFTLPIPAGTEAKVEKLKALLPRTL